MSFKQETIFEAPLLLQLQAQRPLLPVPPPLCPCPYGIMHRDLFRVSRHLGELRKYASYGWGLWAELAPLGTPFAFFFEMRPRISPEFRPFSGRIWCTMGHYLGKVWANFGCNTFRTHLGCLSSEIQLSRLPDHPYCAISHVVGVFDLLAGCCQEVAQCTRVSRHRCTNDYH